MRFSPLSTDAEAVKEVEIKFGVEEPQVLSALLGGDPQDPLRIAYHLIVDNKRIADETSKLEIRVSNGRSLTDPQNPLISPSSCSSLRSHFELHARNPPFQDFFVASSPPTSPSYLSQVFHSSTPGGPLAAANAAATANSQSVYAAAQRARATAAAAAAAAHGHQGGPGDAGDPMARTPAGLRHPERLCRPGDMTASLDPVHKSPTKKSKPKWHLGIRSQSKPLDIMDEVYKVTNFLVILFKISYSHFHR